MALDLTNNFAVGNPTKKDYFDQLLANDAAINAGAIALASQAAKDLMVASSASQWERLSGSGKEADLALARLFRAALRNYREVLGTTSWDGATKTLTLDLSTGNAFDYTTVGDVDHIVFSNAPETGVAFSWTLDLHFGGAHTLAITAHPAAVKWDEDVQPTWPNANGRTSVIGYRTLNGNTRIRGFLGGRNFTT